MDDFLIGVRLRPGQSAGDYRVSADLDLHVGDLCLVETEAGTTLGEVRRPRRPVPEAKREASYRRVLRPATEDEARDHRAHVAREREAVATVQQSARARGLTMKIVDVEIAPRARRVLVSFNAEDRVDFRDLVRGIGPCGRQLCCSSYLRKFDPVAVKMAKAQDVPLTDSRLLGNCGRLKCCLLYEFSTYEALRARLPRVNTPCEASCGGGGCMTGKVRSVRVLKESVVVGFPDGTEAEVPLSQITWEGRSHITFALDRPAPRSGA
jgi:cell fate regulator YaaT (PSP1 superfamily)